MNMKKRNDMATEEQGLLLRLPCKIGDVVYQVTSTINEYKVSSITIYANDNILITADNYEEELSVCFGKSRIGKNYFLSKEEAEQALLEKGKNND